MALKAIVIELKGADASQRGLVRENKWNKQSFLKVSQDYV